MKVTSVEEQTETTLIASPGSTEPSVRALEVPIGHDSRAYSRLPGRINIRYQSFDSKESLEQRGISYEELSCTRNISAGGLLFIGHEPPPGVGSVLALTIELEHGEPSIECLARIVRVHEIDNRTYDIAVCFLDLTGAQRARLEKYVEGETHF